MTAQTPPRCFEQLLPKVIQGTIVEMLSEKGPLKYAGQLLALEKTEAKMEELKVHGCHIDGGIEVLVAIAAGTNTQGQ